MKSKMIKLAKFNYKKVKINKKKLIYFWIVLVNLECKINSKMSKFSAIVF